MKLALAFALAATSCYAPTLRDCTVTCDGADGCAGDQVCGTDGFCVGEASVRCAPEPLVALRVSVMGHGAIDIPDGGTCPGACTYMLPAGTSITATAIGFDGHEFLGWTTLNCEARGQTCTFTLSLAQPLGAKFE